jgi:hypothetical protein
MSIVMTNSISLVHSQYQRCVSEVRLGAALSDRNYRIDVSHRARFLATHLIVAILPDYRFTFYKRMYEPPRIAALQHAVRVIEMSAYRAQINPSASPCRQILLLQT